MPTVPDDLALAGADAARLADQLLRAGRPFHAHEVFEASWKSAPPQERDLWQGLAQIAVGLTHAHRGNARGAVTLLSRGARRVRAYQEQAGPSDEPGYPSGTEPPGEPGHPYGTEPPGQRGHPYGMDIAALLAASDDLVARIERAGLASIPPADLLPKLMPLTPNHSHRPPAEADGL
jgi:hypothetical protein